MAGQGPSRRQLLQALACASLAGSAGGFSRWAYAFGEAETMHMHSGPESGASRVKGPYKPEFFAPAEYKTVEVLAELILPASPLAIRARHDSAVAAASAGATDAGVAEFIDFMVKEDATLQPKFREGLAWLDGAGGSGRFTSLSRSGQVSLLERLAYKNKARPGEELGRTFFALMRRYTVMGFYTSRIGLESLDYPGLRFYAESPHAPTLPS